jgi:hypothetical protein
MTDGDRTPPAGRGDVYQAADRQPGAAYVGPFFLRTIPCPRCGIGRLNSAGNWCFACSPLLGRRGDACNLRLPAVEDAEFLRCANAYLRSDP